MTNRNDDDWGDEPPVSMDFSGLQFDLDDVDETPPEYPVHPKGVYRGKVTSNIFKVSESSGNPMFEMTYDFWDSTGSLKVKVWDYLVFTAEQMWRVKTRLLQFGIPLPKPFIPAEHYRMFVGLEVAAELRIENNAEFGRRNRIVKLMPLTMLETADAF